MQNMYFLEMLARQRMDELMREAERAHNASATADLGGSGGRCRSSGDA